MTKKRGVKFDKIVEMQNLQTAIATINKSDGRKDVVNFKNLTTIVESFLKVKPLVCYGGTAVNAYLPKHAQFYDYDYEIPDYDFFSKNAVNDAIELAHVFKENGFSNIEAKAGMHPGTFKVSVDFIYVADITQLDNDTFKIVLEGASTFDDIMYVSAGYCRMELYKELSLPRGNNERWEKVLTLLILFNQYVPMPCINNTTSTNDMNEIHPSLFMSLQKKLEQLNVIFVGKYAMTFYTKKMDKGRSYLPPLFSVLTMDTTIPGILLQHMQSKNPDCKFTISSKYVTTGEILPRHKILYKDKDALLVIYMPEETCHAYNIVGKLRIASLDTMMNFFLAYTMFAKDIYNPADILCLASELVNIQEDHIGEKKGVMKRFSLNCVGDQKSKRTLLKTRKMMRDTLAYGTPEWDFYFLKYRL